MIKPATSVPKPNISYARLVGRIVEHHRARLRIHQEAMARALEISQSAYSRLEQGQSAMSVTQLRIIAERLGTTPDFLLQHTAQYAVQLRAQGVIVTDQKQVSPAGVLIALGILAALFAAANS
jgi:transcriptional regulator with XRE-family HTH domain